MGFKEKFMSQLAKPMSKAMTSTAEAFSQLQRAQAAATAGPDEPDGQGPPEPESESLSEPGGATPDDWLRLARFCGTTTPKLRAEFPEINPTRAYIRVYRISPKHYKGKKMFCGIVPDLTFDWPFSMAEIEQRVAEECGGEEYELRVYEGTTKVRGIPIRIGAPPKPLYSSGDGQDGDDTRVERLKSKIEEEKLQGQLAETKAERLAAERGLPRQRETEPDNNGEGEQMIAPRSFIMEQPEAEPADIESEVEQRVAKRMVDFELRQEIKELSKRTDEKFDKLAEALTRLGDGGGGGSNSVLAETLRGAFGALQAAFSGNQNPTANIQTELMKMQMENQRANMEFLLRMVEMRGASGGGLGANDTLEAIRTGIELAAERGGGGEGDGDWLQTGVKALTNLVAGEAMRKAETQGQQVDPAMVQAQAEAIARETVNKMMVEAQARRAAAGMQPVPAAPPMQQPGQPMRRRVMVRRPAPPAAVQGGDDVVPVPPEQPEGIMPAPQPQPGQQPAPAPSAAPPPPPLTGTEAEKKDIVNKLLLVVSKEMDERPHQSRILGLARAYLPLDLQQQLLSADEETAMQILLKYADGTTVAALGMKVATNPRVKMWLKQQMSFLRQHLAAFRAASAQQNGGQA